MTAAVLVAPGVVVGAFVMLHATTLLDRLILAPTFDRSEPLATVLDHITAIGTGEPSDPRANPTTRIT